MKNLETIIQDCNLTLDEVKEKYSEIFNRIIAKEQTWLCNIEDKTNRLQPRDKVAIDFVIEKLKDIDYLFTSVDTPNLTTFISKINSIVKVGNRINNFKEGTLLENNQKLILSDVFNYIKELENITDFEMRLNKNLNAFVPHLFSVIKHCQYPERYPIYYKFWRNILKNVLNEKDDYDSFCTYYEGFSKPRHLTMGAYFGTIGTLLAQKISENNIIVEEGDKMYKTIKENLLNIHYFDLITEYKRIPKYYLIGSKYGKKNVDVFPEMKNRNVISVGFTSELDLVDYYLEPENEISDFLINESIEKNAINALKLFLNIKVGDKVAIKASGAPKNGTAFLSINAICEVVPDDNGNVYSYDPFTLGHTLNVRFLNDEYRELTIGGYGRTVQLVNKNEDIKQIFVMNYKSKFKKWLETNNTEGSNKVGSYIRSIEILSEIIRKDLFEVYDLHYLNELYNDILDEQKKENSKYYYEEAPSYGKNNFYSAAVQSYITYIETKDSIIDVTEPYIPMKLRVKNELRQALCIIGESGVGKTYRINETLKTEKHETLFVILDSMWQHLLFDYSPNERKYQLTKIGDFIKLAHENEDKFYTIVIDECHKNLEVVNDVLLQAISTKRNNGQRFLSLNSIVDKEFHFLPEQNGNRILPDNLGFLFISSKSDIIEGNDDLKNRIEIIELTKEDQDAKEYTIGFLLNKVKKQENSDYSN